MVSESILWWERVPFGKWQHPMVNESILWWARVFSECPHQEWGCSVVSESVPWSVEMPHGEWKYCFSPLSFELWSMLYQWHAKHQVSTCVLGGPVYFSFWLNLCHPHEKNVSRLTHWSWRKKPHEISASILDQTHSWAASRVVKIAGVFYEWVRDIAITRWQKCGITMATTSKTQEQSIWRLFSATGYWDGLLYSHGQVMEIVSSWLSF